MAPLPESAMQELKRENDLARSDTARFKGLTQKKTASNHDCWDRTGMLTTLIYLAVTMPRGNAWVASRTRNIARNKILMSVEVLQKRGTPEQ